MTDFENYSVFTPAAYHAQAMKTQLDQLVAWAGALRTVREEQQVVVAA